VNMNEIIIDNDWYYYIHNFTTIHME
jgi:hypothetical protein